MTHGCMSTVKVALSRSMPSMVSCTALYCPFCIQSTCTVHELQLCLNSFHCESHCVISTACQTSYTMLALCISENPNKCYFFGRKYFTRDPTIDYSQCHRWRRSTVWSEGQTMLRVPAVVLYFAKPNNTDLVRLAIRPHQNQQPRCVLQNFCTYSIASQHGHAKQEREPCATRAWHQVSAPRGEADPRGQRPRSTPGPRPAARMHGARWRRSTQGPPWPGQARTRRCANGRTAFCAATSRTACRCANGHTAFCAATSRTACSCANGRTAFCAATSRTACRCANGRNTFRAACEQERALAATPCHHPTLALLHYPPPTARASVRRALVCRGQSHTPLKLSVVAHSTRPRLLRRLLLEVAKPTVRPRRKLPVVPVKMSAQRLQRPASCAESAPQASLPMLKRLHHPIPRCAPSDQDLRPGPCNTLQNIRRCCTQLM